MFELTDALLCTDGPVHSLVGLCLAPEHSRGHGALYDALTPSYDWPAGSPMICAAPGSGRCRPTG